MGYSKEFLIDAFLWRYTDTLLEMTTERMNAFVEMVHNFYYIEGKEKFRLYCSLDAEELRKFKLATGY